MRAPSSHAVIGVILICIAAVSWSTAGLFTRIVTTDIPTILFWRSLFGGLSVFIIYIIAHRPKALLPLFRFSLGEIVLACVSGIAMCLFISAFFYTSIANVSFIYGTSPLETVMLAWLLLKDKPAIVTTSATFVSGCGVAILAWGGQDFTDAIGLLLAGGMTVLMASLAVFVKYFPHTDAGKATYLSALIAMVAMVPFVESFAVNAHNFIWLAVYGFVNVGLGFGIYLIGVARVSPATAALLGLLEVPLAPIWAAYFFNEALTIAMIIGGVLITAAASIHIRATAS